MTIVNFPQHGPVAAQMGATPDHDGTDEMDKVASRNSELEQIFASALTESDDFRAWLLSRTKFARLWPLVRLMQHEQQAARGDAPWWRNGPSETRLGAATKMLLVFEVEQTKLRFALHVETATDGTTLNAAKDNAYKKFAQSQLNQPRLFNYMDFETVLLAPQSLILSDGRALNFDRRIPFQTIAGFLPQFGGPRLVAA